MMGRQNELRQVTERLLTPAEVAQAFRVDPKTVSRWAKQGKLTSTLTPGGHHRFYEAEVRELLSEGNNGRLSGITG